MRLISTAIQPSSSSRHMRSTGPMSVGHSRRTRRKPSPHQCGWSASSSCRSRSTPSLTRIAPAAGSPMSCVTSESTSWSVDVQGVVALDLAHDDAAVLLLDRRRRRHPVQRLVAAGVRVDHHRPVGLDHEQAQRLGQVGAQPSGVVDLAAGDDQTHGPGTVARPQTSPGAEARRPANGPPCLRRPSGYALAGHEADAARSAVAACRG